MEFYFLEIFASQLSFRYNFWDLYFKRFLNWFLLNFTTFLSILFCIFFLLFHLFLLFYFGLFFFDLFYLYKLDSIDIGELNMVSDIGIVYIEHRNRVRMSHQNLQFSTTTQITYKLLQFTDFIPSNIQASQLTKHFGQPNKSTIIDLIPANR